MSQTTPRFTRDNQPPFHAAFHSPPTKARAYALFIHCLNTFSSHTQQQVIEPLVRTGISVLSLDISGSDAQAPTSELQALSISDIEQTIQWLTENHFTPQICLGHSIGCLPLLAMSKTLPELRAIVCIGTPTTTDIAAISDTADLFSPTTITTTLGTTTIKLDASLVETVRKQQIQILLQQKAPVLLLHATQDNVYPFDAIRTLALPTQHSFISLHTGDHQLSTGKTAMLCGDLATTWINNQLIDYTENAASILATNDKQAIHQNVTVSESKAHSYQHIARLGDHHLFIDLPTEANGNNSGPNPTQLLLAALSSSASIAIRKYAQKKAWQLESIHIESRLVQNAHSSNAAIPSSEHIILEITLTGALDSIQKNALIDISNNSDIHNRLETKIITRFITS